MGMVLPTIHALERLRPDIECILIALTTGYLKAKAVRPVLGYNDLLYLVDMPMARMLGKNLSLENSSPDVPIEETVAYLGINYLDLIEQYGASGAERHYIEKGRRGFFPINFMQRVIAALNPDIVVATNSPRSEQAALQAAKRLKIPTVGMVDLYGMETDNYVQRVCKPDKTCVISDVVKSRLVDRGFNPSSVIVTGNPSFDGLFSGTNQQLAQRFLAAHGWEGLIPVLWAGHTEPYGHPDTLVQAGKSLPIQIENELRALVRGRPELALIIRYHPSDWYSYPRQPYEARVHFSETPKEPLHPLILASGVVVVQTSTVGLEAAVAGKLVISIENSPASLGGFSLARLGVSIPCASPSALPMVIDDCLRSDKSLPRALTYKSDGNASYRVATVVSSTCSN
jgi:hypothetical protein